MTTNPGFAHRNACRALALLLCYPDDEMRALLPAIKAERPLEPALSGAACEALYRLADELLAADALEVQAQYVDCFDRGRRTSLHLFEHVHGDSRERGPAMIDLLQTYEKAGLYLTGGELPDYLPAVLEFASTQPADVAQAFLAEMAHILNALHAALQRKGSPYAAVIAAVLELAGEPLRPIAVAEEEPVDDSWAEPEAFDGCSSAGSQRPAQPQPVHVVRRAAHAAANPGAAA
ncbi:MAG TPA: nitrate reductase molybdenum cofactor assembly chaperone [Methylibium sp.]